MLLIKYIIFFILTVFLGLLLYFLVHKKIIPKFFDNQQHNGLFGDIASLITATVAVLALDHTSEIASAINDLKNTAESTTQAVSGVQKAIDQLRIERRFIAIDRSFRPDSPLIDVSKNKDEIFHYIKKEYSKNLNSLGSFFIPDEKLDQISSQIYEKKDINQRKKILESVIELDSKKE